MNAPSGTCRVLLLTSVISPYRLPSFESLARERGIDFMAVFLKRGDARHPWRLSFDLRFRHAVIPSGWASSWRTMQLLKRHRPDVLIVGGWNLPSYWIAAMTSRLVRSRFVIWNESTRADHRKSSFLREWAKRRMVRSSDAILVPGSAAEAYARSLGASRVVVAVNAIENASFLRHESTPRSPLATVLFVGRLAHEKGVDVLLRAWKAVEEAATARLRIIGSGPEGLGLRALAEALNLSKVEWLGFVQPHELVGHYREADLLVLPSRSEAWGFVVNEAMASGLPVVVTEQVGSRSDLVLDGTTGLVVPPDDVESLAEAIQRLLADPSLRRMMGERALQHISSFSPEGWAHTVTKLVRELT